MRRRSGQLLPECRSSRISSATAPTRTTSRAGPADGDPEQHDCGAAAAQRLHATPTTTPPTSRPALRRRATRPRRSNVCGGPPPNQPVSATCGGGADDARGHGGDADGHRDRSRRHRHGLQRGRHARGGGDRDLGPDAGVGAVGGTASATVSVADTVAPGTYSVQVTASNDDATPQTGTCSFSGHRHARSRRSARCRARSARPPTGCTHRSPFAPPSGNGAGATVVRQGRRLREDARAAPRRARASTASSSRTPRPRRTATRSPRTGSGSSWARFRDILNVRQRPAELRAAGRRRDRPLRAALPSSSTSRSSRARASSR